MGQVTRSQALATEIERDGSDPIRALFLTVLMHALRDNDAKRWLASKDGQLVCALADVDPDYARTAIGGPRNPIRVGG